MKEKRYTEIDLEIYLEEINKYPLLSRKEEENYAKLAAKGDKSAAETLINSNLRFVVSTAKKYQNQGLSLGDLIQEGDIGLMRAIEKNDPRKGYKFISYAVWWIKQSIRKALEKGRDIRLPDNQYNRLSRISRYLDEHPEEGLDIKKISKETFIKPDKVEELIPYLTPTLSINNKSKGWYGRIKHLRRTDELLRPDGR